MNLKIRKMMAEDVAVAHEIDRISFTLPWPERSLRFEVTDNPAARCWVVEVDERVVAMMILWMIVDEAHIATIAVRPEVRQQGIAAKLLSHGLESACQEGAEKALLEVRAGNEAARALYRKFGFVEDGRRLHYYKDNGEDAVLMSLSDLSVFHSL